MSQVATEVAKGQVAVKGGDAKGKPQEGNTISDAEGSAKVKAIAQSAINAMSKRPQGIIRPAVSDEDRTHNDRVRAEFQAWQEGVKRQGLMALGALAGTNKNADAFSCTIRPRGKGVKPDVFNTTALFDLLTGNGRASYLAGATLI